MTVIDPTMDPRSSSEHHERGAGVDQGAPWKPKAIELQRDLRGVDELRFDRASPVSHNGESGIIARGSADGPLQHHEPVGLDEDDGIRIKNSSDDTMTCISSGASESHKVWHPQPAKLVAKEPVRNADESHGVNAEEPTSFGSLQPSLEDASGHAETIMPALNTDHFVEAEEDPTPHVQNQDVGSVNGCITDDWANADSDHLCIGRDNKIQRWVPGSYLTFFVDSSSFRSMNDATHVATSVVAAAKQWNELGGKVPYFGQVDKISAAVFRIRYTDKPEVDNGKTYFAKAFLPGDTPTVYVYKSSFENDYRDYLENIFCHELGHILGARHGFAPEKEPPCQVLGDRHLDSVMNYPNHPSKLAIHASDARDMKRLYELTDAQYNGYPIEDYPAKMLDPSTTGTKDTERMDERVTFRVLFLMRVPGPVAMENSWLQALVRAACVALLTGIVYTMGWWLGA